MKSRQNQSIWSKYALGVLALIGLVAADQPVHCIKENVMGDWTFTVTEASTLPNLFNSESVCTHELPNKLQIIEQDHKFKFADSTYKVHITLEDNN